MAEASKRLDVDSKSIRCWMGQSERGELKATSGTNKLTADQLHIRELERERSIALIDPLRTKHPVRKLCDLLNAAKSGYQAWRSGRVMPPRKLEDMRLLVAIKAAHQRGRGTYGPSKIQSQ